MMYNEIWKDITGYEGLYQVSDLGKVKSLDRKVKNFLTKGFSISKGKVLKPWVSKGYLRVGLSKNGKHKYFSVHVLVAKTFIKNSENKPHVNHIDGVNFNNTLLNLEWMTAKENVNHAIHILQRNSTNKWVLNTETGIYYLTIKDAVYYSSTPYSVAYVGQMLLGKWINKTNLIVA